MFIGIGKRFVIPIASAIFLMLALSSTFAQEASVKMMTLEESIETALSENLSVTH